MSCCSHTITYDEAIEKNRKNFEDPQQLGDAIFLVEMKSANLLHLELLQTAAQAGYSSELVNLGKEEIGAFKTVAQDLTEVARGEEARVPTEMSKDHEFLVQLSR